MTDARSRWPRVKEIFHSALACAPDQRAAFLRDRCGEDDALRDDVEAWLEAHEDAGRFAEGPAIDALDSDEFLLHGGAPALTAAAECGAYRNLAAIDRDGHAEASR